MPPAVSPRGSRVAARGAMCGLLLAAAWTAVADPPAAPPPREAVCQRTVDKIVIDGKLDEATWKAATPLPLDLLHPFKEGQKLEKPAGFARLAWDDESIYIAFEVFDDDVRAAGDKRDEASYSAPNDVVEVFLDINNDDQHFVEVHVNPLNALNDLFIIRPPPESPLYQRVARHGIMFLPGWNLAKYETAVQVQGTLNNPKDKDTGWTAEIRLPYTSLLMPQNHPKPAVGDIWRVQPVIMNGGNDGDVKDRYITWSPSCPPAPWTFFHHAIQTWGRVTFGK